MTAWTTTPPTVAVGQKGSASLWNGAVRDPMLALGPLTTYTPAWASSGTAPAVGNGTLSGAWGQVQKMVFVTGKLLLGSTSTVGTGNYTLSLPVPADLTITNIPYGAVWFRDTSASADYDGNCIIATASTLQFRGLNAAYVGGSVWSATAPVVPANGDWLAFSLWYWAA